MIKRHYAYNITLQDINPQFCCGILTVRSWLPDPVLAWNSAFVNAAKQWGCDKSKVRIESFVKV